MEARQSVQLPKRTRRNVKQSKNGCFTCKARRKKCGEERPRCTRCIVAGLRCEGYAADRTASSTSSLLPTFTPGQPFSAATRTGLDILIQTSDHSQPWSTLLPVLTRTSPLLNAAMTALGATYQAAVLPSGGADPRSMRMSAHGGYHAAVIALRRNLLAQPSSSPSSSSSSSSVAECFLAAIVLAAMETLHFRLEAALAHLHGAYQALALQQPAAQAASHNGLDQTKLKQLAALLDVQTMSFALSLPSALPVCAADAPDDLAADLSQADMAHLPAKVAAILRTCYNFATQVSQYKYTALIAKDVLMMQGWCAGLLRRARKSLDHRIAHEADDAHISASLCSFRVQIVSALIYLYSLFLAEESTYNKHLEEFRHILEDCRVSLDQRPHSPLGFFRPISSLSQSLFFTAVKCRDIEVRRSAISLLGRTGIEGPWDARILTVVASRVVEIESSSCLEGQSSAARDERGLVHGCAWQHVGDSRAVDGELRFTARFSRCVDIRRMVEGTYPDAEGQCTPWDSSENWEVWLEEFQIARGIS